MADVPHFSLPFRFDIDSVGEAHAAENEQDSLADVTDCVQAILRTPLGSREELPEFGLRDMTFSPGGIDTDEIQAAIALWESRADLLIEEDSTLLDLFISIVKVKPSLAVAIIPDLTSRST